MLTAHLFVLNSDRKVRNIRQDGNIEWLIFQKIKFAQKICRNGTNEGFDFDRDFNYMGLQIKEVYANFQNFIELYVEAEDTEFEQIQRTFGFF